MFSKPLAVGVLVALACITGAAGGAYFAGRHSTGDTNAEAAVQAPPAPPSAAQDTEAVIAPPAGTAGAPAPAVEAPAAPAPSVALETEQVKTVPAAPVRPRRTESRPAARPSSTTTPRTPASAANTPAPAAVANPAPDPVPMRTEPPVAADPAPVEPVRADPPPPSRELVELEVPSTSVIGLRIETPVSTETAHLEDRVEARVMRDLSVDGRTAIPAGTRALGAVTMVERGGKVKERARLGVRFHTLVLADGAQLPIRTDTIIREGESPAGDSARKIGGAAVGGAILGALMGGKKGAIVGSTAGAAGGTAVVMAGDRNAATLPAGAVVTVRLSSPVSVEVEKK